MLVLGIWYGIGSSAMEATQKIGSCWWPSDGCYGNERSAMQCHGCAQVLKRKYFKGYFPGLEYIVLMIFLLQRFVHCFYVHATQYSTERGKHENVTISRIWKPSISYLSSSLDYAACKITRGKNNALWSIFSQIRTKKADEATNNNNIVYICTMKMNKSMKCIISGEETAWAEAAQ